MRFVWICYDKGMANETPHIDIPRLFADLQVSEADLEQATSLSIPSDVRVPSVSDIKIATVEDVLSIVNPSESFDVIGVRASSGVAEQPFGQIAIDGALNRINQGMLIREQVAAGESGATSWFSIENGLFRVARQAAIPVARGRSDEGIVQLAEDADLSPDFDPDAEYEDRAVAAIRIPGYPTLVQISPSTEAVRFPKAAVLAAYNADGGFDEHTVGSKLVEMGIVQDKQNPHLELTADRPGGPLPRQDQMARVIIRALVYLARW